MSASAIILEIVCPVLGVILSNAMYLAPYRLVMQARVSRHLGSINPMPFAITFVSSIGWTMYSCMLSNYYLFLSSFLGILFGLFYSITCLTIMAKEAYEDEFTEQYMQIEGLLVAGLFFWCVLGIVQTSIFNDFNDPAAQQAQMIGNLCSAFSICYYASPLWTLREVVRSRDSSSLYLPTILTNMTNTLLWFSYGAFGVHNPVVWAPALTGLLLSVLQVCVVVVFHKGRWRWLRAVKGEPTHDSIKVRCRTRSMDGDPTISFVITEPVNTRLTNLSEDRADPDVDKFKTIDSPVSPPGSPNQSPTRNRKVSFDLQDDSVTNPLCDQV